MSRQASLFDEGTPAADRGNLQKMQRTAQAPGWRKPTDPREHACRNCEGVAVCGIGDAWFCLQCVPPSFWPANREGAAR